MTLFEGHDSGKVILRIPRNDPINPARYRIDLLPGEKSQEIEAMDSSVQHDASTG